MYFSSTLSCIRKQIYHFLGPKYFTFIAVFAPTHSFLPLKFPGKNFSLAPCKPSTFTTTKFTMTFYRSYQNIKMMDVIFLNMTPRRFVVNLVSFQRNTFLEPYIFAP
jgi:hypothetical protein